MSINYGVRQNALTTPPSNTCVVEPKDIFGYDEISAAINGKNPTLPVATIATVIQALKDEIIVQLLAGNTVKFENFVSFVTTLPGKLALPTDPADKNKLQIIAKIAPLYKEELRMAAELVRTGYPVKGPQIVAAFDTNLDMQNFIETGRPFKIIGANFAFDPSDTEQGVFTTTTAGVTTRQTNIAQNLPSGIIIIPAANVITDGGKVDVTVTVKTRYTQNGLIKTGTLVNRVRGLHSGSNVLFGMSGGSNPVEYTAAGLSSGDRFVFVANLRPDNNVEISVGLFANPGLFGAAVVMTEENVGYTISTGEETPQEFTVEISNLELLKTNLLLSGRYMQDVSAYAAA